MTAPTKEELDHDLEMMDEEHMPEKVEDTTGSIPDGSYQTRLEKIYFDNINEKLKIIAVFEIVADEYESRAIWKFINLETKENLNYAALDMRRLGVKKDFIWSKLPEFFPDLLDNHYQVTLKTKNDFQNVYINKKIDLDDVAESNPGDDIPKDDTPF